MRRNLLQGVLFLCGTVGVLDIGYHLGHGALLPSAEGQAAVAASADVIVTAANTQNEAFCFVFNKTTNQIVSYMQRSTGGLELKGIRNTSSDFNAQIQEYPDSQSDTAVKNMKKIAEKLAKDKENKEKKK